MTQADVGNLHVGHGPGNDDLLVAPVKLECLAGLEYEWDVGVGRTSLMFCPPVLHKTTHAIVSTAVTLSGCATITNDPTQPIQFVAPGCQGVDVECSAENKRSSWTFEPPETVHIRRSDDVLRIRCDVPGRRDHVQSIPSRMDGKIVASAIFLDLGIVDSITDKHREYPAQIVLTACEDE